MNAIDHRVRNIWELRADRVYGIPVGGCGSPGYLRAVRYLIEKYGHLVNVTTVSQRKGCVTLLRAEEMPAFTPAYILFPETTWCIGRVAYMRSVNREQLLGYAVELLSTTRSAGIKYQVGSYWHQLAVQAHYFLRCVTASPSKLRCHPMYPFLLEWQPVLEQNRASVSEALIEGRVFLGKRAQIRDLRVVPEY